MPLFSGYDKLRVMEVEILYFPKRQETLPGEIKALHAIAENDQSIAALASSLLKWFAEVFVPLGLPMIGTAQIARGGIKEQQTVEQVIKGQINRVD